MNLKILMKTLYPPGVQRHCSHKWRGGMSDILGRGDPRAFDVVLLDILMPEMNGYETLRAIKSDNSLRELPVLMIYSDRRDDERDRMHQDGRDGLPDQAIQCRFAESEDRVVYGWPNGCAIWSWSIWRRCRS